MAWYHMVLIGAAAVAALLAWNVPRAVQWLSLGALSYVSSAMWHNAGLPYATFFGAATNLAICYGFWIFADQRWEMRLWNMFHLMLVVDILYMAGFIRDRMTFAVALELINLIAILLIWATGIVERAYGINIDPDRGRWIDSVHRRLWPERSMASRPWWQKSTTQTSLRLSTGSEDAHHGPRAAGRTHQFPFYPGHTRRGGRGGGLALSSGASREARRPRSAQDRDRREGQDHPSAAGSETERDETDRGADDVGELDTGNLPRNRDRKVMMKAIRNIQKHVAVKLGLEPTVRPVTIKDVNPAPLVRPDLAVEQRKAAGEAAAGIVAVTEKADEIRRVLAGQALRIVARGHR